MKVKKIIVRHPLNIGDQSDPPLREKVSSSVVLDKRMAPISQAKQQSDEGKLISETLKSMNGLDDYLNQYGPHFTDKLADWATHQMVNGSGENHHWSTSDIEKSFARMGLQKPESMTWGDAMYSSNMHYADYYGKSLPTEKDCLIQAHADLTDIDGYPGKIFNRWYSDMLGKHVDVPWSDFI